MKQYRTKYITVYLSKQTYGGPEEGGWYYDLATVDTVFSFRDNKQRERAIRKAKDMCDRFNTAKKEFWDKYDYMFYKEESKKKLGKDYRTKLRYYE